MPADIHALLKRAAEIEGRTMTDFIVAAASAAARKTIEENAMLRLSADDQLRFAQSLLEPAPLTPALKRALKHHQRNAKRGPMNG